MDNSENRLVDVFFYGLYMDEEILLKKGVKIRNQRKAYVKDFVLRVGKMATLLRAEKKEAHGLVYELTQKEIDILYKDSGLIEYVGEAILLHVDNKSITALVCNLLVPPLKDDKNEVYVEKLLLCMNKYKLPLPTEY